MTRTRHQSGFQSVAVGGRSGGWVAGLAATSRNPGGSAISVNWITIATGGGNVVVWHTWLQLPVHVQPQSHPAPIPVVSPVSSTPECCPPCPACIAEDMAASGVSFRCLQALNAAAPPVKASSQTRMTATRRRKAGDMIFSSAQFRVMPNPSPYPATHRSRRVAACWPSAALPCSLRQSPPWCGRPSF